MNIFGKILCALGIHKTMSAGFPIRYSVRDVLHNHIMSLRKQRYERQNRSLCFGPRNGGLLRNFNFNFIAV